MSFLTDLFSGNTGNLGNDLSPSSFFSDTQKDIGGANTLPEILGGVALAAGGLGLAGLAGGAGATAAAGAPLDILAGGAAEGTADTSAVGDLFAGGIAAGDATTSGIDLSALGLTADDASAFATDPGIAAINAAAPLGTSAGAAAPGAGIGTLSVPGLPDASVAATDITNDAGVAGSTSSPSFLSQLVSGATNSITKNPLGIAAAGVGLGVDLLKGNKTDPNAAALSAEAPALEAQGASLSAVGTNLTSYLQNGTLPPGQQAQVTQAVQAAKARIIANAAANGQNTNPTQNSALAQDLSQADLNGLALAGQLETQLAQVGTSLIQGGLQETGLSEEIYQALVNIDTKNNDQLMSAIASMAAALGGGTRISIGGANATLGT